MKDKYPAPQEESSNKDGEKDTLMQDSRRGFLERLGDIVLSRIAKHSDPSNKTNNIKTNTIDSSLSYSKDKRRMESEIDKVLMEMGGGTDSQDNNVVVDMKKKQSRSEEGIRQAIMLDKNLEDNTVLPGPITKRTKVSTSQKQKSHDSPNTHSKPAVLTSSNLKSSYETTNQRLRLSEDEKSKVYERVRNLISNAKQASISQEKTIPVITRSLNICYFDDSRTSSQTTYQALSAYGHRVDHFSSVSEIMEAIHKNTYDLLLLSQGNTSEGANCLELVRAVKRSKKIKITIAVLTSEPAVANIRSYMQVGADKVIVKPIEGKELNERLVETHSLWLKKQQTVNGLKICFLEDSCTSSQAIREALSEHGHLVEHFSSAEEAFDALMEKNYDVLLASQIVALGGMDCETLISSLQNTSRRSIPIIALTANPENNNVKNLKDHGANEVIVKPVEGQILNERILRALETKSKSITTKKSLSICFLEDSCTSSQAIREMLGDQGHVVDHFSSAEEALDAVLEKKYDVLLASEIVAVGGLDCAGLIRAIRKSDNINKKTLPIVVLTTNTNIKSHQKIISSGANNVIVKPIEAKELSHRLLSSVTQNTEHTHSEVEKWRICFLEDSCTSSQAIREILGEHGHEVDHFTSPEEAYDALLEKEYDLLLASQIFALGGLDSEGLIKAVRGSKLSIKSQIPIVVLTANTDPQNIETFIKAGANDVLMKPVKGDLNQLLRDTLFRESPRGKPKLRVVSNRAGENLDIRSGKKNNAAAIPVLETRDTGESLKAFTSISIKKQINDKLPPARKAIVTASGQTPIAEPPAEMQQIQKTPPVLRARAESNKLATPFPTKSPRKQEATQLDKANDSLIGLLEPSLKTDLENERHDFRSSTISGRNTSGTGGNKLRIATIAALLGLASFGIYNWINVDKRIPVQLVAVEQGPLFQTIKVPGRVVSKKKVEITSAVAGQITSVSSKEGDFVTKGSVMAQLDDSERRIQFEQAEAKLESAKKDVTLTERTLDRLVRALQMGAVSRQMAEDAEAAVHAARARMRVAAEELRAAQLALDKLNIVAPFDGVVTTSFAIEGLWAEPPGPLFTLVDMRQREAELKVDAADSSNIRVGQTVVLTSDAMPGQQWKETVVRMASAANKDDMASNTFNVYVSLGSNTPDLRFGQQVDAEVRTAANDNATKVPFGAVVTHEGRTSVALVENGEVQYQPVTTGIEDLTHIQIVSGLKPGQKVIMLNKELEEGQKVEPAISS